MEATTETEAISNLPATLDADHIELPAAVVMFGKNGPEQLIAQIQRLARDKAKGCDATTESGRAELKSIAYAVARTKTTADDHGKRHTEDQKRVIDDVNAGRRKIREAMEALQDEIRKPVTEWETADKVRIERHEQAISALEALVQFDGLPSAATLRSRLEQFKSRLPRDWEEYYDRALELIVRVEKTLTDGLDRQQRYETEQAELAELRAERSKREADAAAEQQRRDQEAADRAAEVRRKADLEAAAAQAKREAEEKAERDAAASHAAFEAKLRDAEETVRREREEAAAKARESERLRVEAEQRVEFERARAEEARTQAAAMAERNHLAAIEAERSRVEQERLAQEAEDRKRAENTEHRRKINKAILVALKEHLSIDAKAGEALVKAIIEGKIPRVSVNY